MGKCSFSQAWLTHSKYQHWIESSSDGSKFRARCRLCQKDFDVSNMGEAALKSHMAGKKHALLEQGARKSSGSSNMFMEDFFTTKSTSTLACEPCTSAACEPSTSVEGSVGSKSSCGSASNQTTLAKTVTKNDVLTAEVYWTMFAMEKHFSFKSFDGLGDIFTKMFPGYEVAQQFQCGETKARYLATFGIAPYFSELLISRARSAEEYVLLFDESLNQELQQKQLDMHVRFWDGNEVKTHYLISRFLGHATADNLYTELEECCNVLGKRGILQLSMDGPNVNWATYDKLKEDIEEETGKRLYNIGSCGLHTLHNAFKSAYNTLGWDIDHKLNSLYWLFKDSPARREDFTQLTGCSLFPKKFCSHRWLENVIVCKRALEMWPHVVTFVNDAVKKNKCPQTKSFSEVRSCCSDRLFTVRLNIFLSLAHIIEPFLAKYQTDKPVLPFLAEDLRQVVVTILERFLKPEAVEKMDSVSSMIREIHDVSDSKLHVDSLNIDCGYIPNAELKELKKKGSVSEADIVRIKLDTKKCMIQLVTKLLEKAPVRYGLVRFLDWLKPAHILTNKTAAKQNLKRCLDYMVGRGNIQKTECDSIISNFGEFAAEVAGNDDFLSFDRETDRLDTLFFSSQSHRKEWKNLWEVTRKVLVLSHGQASVERGFSVNKAVTADNMKQTTLTALRIITDHLTSVGGASAVPITKQLLASAATAKSRYNSYLEEQREEREKQEAAGKRKRIQNELHEMNAKKRKLETCVKDMLKSADEFAEKAEQSENYTFLSKSNALRRSAKKKREEVSVLEAKINEKVKEMKK